MSITEPLLGKVCLVTGAASGIGRAIAIECARQGAAFVVVTDLSADALQATAALVSEAGAQTLIHPCDLRDEAAIAGLMADTVERFGRIDVLINNAAVHEKALAPQSETTTDTLATRIWDLVMEVNVRGSWLTTKYAAERMRLTGGGAIVNAASQQGFVGTPAQPAYNASKGAVIQLTRSAAVDLAPYGIRVNAFAPGAVDTPMVSEIFDRQDDPETAMARMLETYLIKRLGTPEDIAAAACFLASDAAAFVTGTVLVVDGGQTAWR
ncbi:glucose 1-dehydrogenase [Rathayibacter sp. ZW T2_19]|uniref:Glucose 1-dehydrogenase n=1 Tax=Rathayibacter rubneri TaxID=2950106 RepID=A0A9X2IT31_9MICO|nr:glucose 1-dehydrogenase [Rathayibacter rubneri]MCM6761219.1 glucose 1-dehydrogenase [Rathayibacter rubneri]